MKSRYEGLASTIQYERNFRLVVGSAIAQAEHAVNSLVAERAFLVTKKDEEGYDWEAIDYHMSELEGALDIIADGMTPLIDPKAENAFTIDEILSQTDGVSPEIVSIAAILTETLGTTGSIGGNVVEMVKYVGVDHIKKLLETLRDITKNLKKPK